MAISAIFIPAMKLIREMREERFGENIFIIRKTSKIIHRKTFHSEITKIEYGVNPLVCHMTPSTSIETKYFSIFFQVGNLKGQKAEDSHSN